MRCEFWGYMSIPDLASADVVHAQALAGGGWESGGVLGAGEEVCCIVHRAFVEPLCSATHLDLGGLLHGAVRAGELADKAGEFIPPG